MKSFFLLSAVALISIPSALADSAPQGEHTRRTITTFSGKVTRSDLNAALGKPCKLLVWQESWNSTIGARYDGTDYLANEVSFELTRAELENEAFDGHGGPKEVDGILPYGYYKRTLFARRDSSGQLQIQVKTFKSGWIGAIDHQAGDETCTATQKSVEVQCFFNGDSEACAR